MGDGILNPVLQQPARRGEQQESWRRGGKRMLEADDEEQGAQITTEFPSLGAGTGTSYPSTPVPGNPTSNPKKCPSVHNTESEFPKTTSPSATSLSRPSFPQIPVCFGRHQVCRFIPPKCPPPPHQNSPIPPTILSSAYKQRKIWVSLARPKCRERSSTGPGSATQLLFAQLKELFQTGANRYALNF